MLIKSYNIETFEKYSKQLCVYARFLNIPNNDIRDAFLHDIT